MTDAGYLTVGIYSEFNWRSVCRPELNAALFSHGSSIKILAPIMEVLLHTISIFLRKFTVIQRGKVYPVFIKFISVFPQPHIEN
jgi:hypothetical protein